MSSEVSRIDGVLTGNLLLDSLPQDAAAALVPQLESIAMPMGLRCTEMGLAVKSVWFPIASVVSVVARLHGQAHEVNVIGREGAVGAIEVLLEGPSLYESFVQVPDSGLMIAADKFESVLAEQSGLRKALLRYVHATIGTSLQAGACNGSHDVNRRCAKWLLVAHDRVLGDSVNLTHAFLGQMLNVRRAGVNRAAVKLQQQGAIAYVRGKITITDRSLLERLSCECYKTINDNAALVLGYDVREKATARSTSSASE